MKATILIFGITILLATTIGTADSTADCHLRILPEDTTVCTGETFEVNVHVNEGAVNLMGYNITVSFDTALLCIEEVYEGSLPINSGHPTFFRWLNEGDDDDCIFVNGSILGNTVEGPGVLFTIKFKAGKVGTDSLCVVDSELRNNFNRAITHTPHCGTITIETEVGTIDTPWGVIKTMQKDCFRKERR
jgi:hypothetical protein